MQVKFHTERRIQDAVFRTAITAQVVLCELARIPASLVVKKH